MRVRFLRCMLDPEARSLARDGVSVHLTPKAFDVLALLVARRPRVIAKSELLDAIWPGTFVTDASLARTIHEIRTAIGDDGKEGAVRTVHGYGYAFAAEAHEEPAAGPVPEGPAPRVAWLLLGSRIVPLTAGSHLVGRDPSVTIAVESGQASWHARLDVAPGEVTLVDLASKNGTYVNGRRLASAVRLSDGDEIQIGSSRLTVRLGDRPDHTLTADGQPS